MNKLLITTAIASSLMFSGQALADNINGGAHSYPTSATDIADTAGSSVTHGGFTVTSFTVRGELDTFDDYTQDGNGYTSSSRYRLAGTQLIDQGGGRHTFASVGAGIYQAAGYDEQYVVVVENAASLTDGIIYLSFTNDRWTWNGAFSGSSSLQNRPTAADAATYIRALADSRDIRLTDADGTVYTTDSLIAALQAEFDAAQPDPTDTRTGNVNRPVTKANGDTFMYTIWNVVGDNDQQDVLMSPISTSVDVSSGRHTITSGEVTGNGYYSHLNNPGRYYYEVTGYTPFVAPPAPLVDPDTAEYYTKGGHVAFFHDGQYHLDDNRDGHSDRVSTGGGWLSIDSLNTVNFVEGVAGSATETRLNREDRDTEFAGAGVENQAKVAQVVYALNGVDLTYYTSAGDRQLEIDSRIEAIDAEIATRTFMGTVYPTVQERNDASVAYFDAQTDAGLQAVVGSQNEKLMVAEADARVTFDPATDTLTFLNVDYVDGEFTALSEAVDAEIIRHRDAIEALRDLDYQGLADSAEGIGYDPDRNILFIEGYTDAEVSAISGRINVFLPTQAQLAIAVGIRADLLAAADAAATPDTLSDWSEWSQISFHGGKEVEVSATYKGKTITGIALTDRYITEARTRTVIVNGDEDETAPAGELRQRRTRLVSENNEDSVRAALLADLKVQFVAAANKLSDKIGNDIKHGQKLTGKFDAFTLVINTATAGVEIRKEFVVAKAGVDRLTITPRLGVGGIGKDYNYTSAGAEIAYENTEVRDLLIKLGYDTGTHFDFTDGKLDGFRGLGGNGNTGDYGFVEIHQGASDEIKVTVRHDTQGDYKVGLRKGPYSASVNQDGQVEVNYTIKF